MFLLRCTLSSSPSPDGRLADRKAIIDLVPRLVPIKTLNWRLDSTIWTRVYSYYFPQLLLTSSRPADNRDALLSLHRASSGAGVAGICPKPAFLAAFQSPGFIVSPLSPTITSS